MYPKLSLFFPISLFFCAPVATPLFSTGMNTKIKLSDGTATTIRALLEEFNDHAPGICEQAEWAFAEPFLREIISRNKHDQEIKNKAIALLDFINAALAPEAALAASIPKKTSWADDFCEEADKEAVYQPVFSKVELKSCALTYPLCKEIGWTYQNLNDCLWDAGIDFWWNENTSLDAMKSDLQSLLHIPGRPAIFTPLCHWLAQTNIRASELLEALSWILPLFEEEIYTKNWCTQALPPLTPEELSTPLRPLDGKLTINHILNWIRNSFDITIPTEDLCGRIVALQILKHTLRNTCLRKKSISGDQAQITRCLIFFLESFHLPRTMVSVEYEARLVACVEEAPHSPKRLLHTPKRRSRLCNSVEVPEEESPSFADTERDVDDSPEQTDSKEQESPSAVSRIKTDAFPSTLKTPLTIFFERLHS